MADENREIRSGNFVVSSFVVATSCIGHFNSRVLSNRVCVCVCVAPLHNIKTKIAKCPNLRMYQRMTRISLFLSIISSRVRIIFIF